MLRTAITPKFGFQPPLGLTEVNTPQVSYYGNAANPYVRVMQPIAPGAYGIQNQGVQPYLPINGKRTLSEAEEQKAQIGLSRLMPKLFSDYSTPMTSLLSSPAKGAIIAGAIGLMPGVVFSAAHPASLLVGVAIGLLAGTLTYLHRRQRNGNILELMKRLPPDATKRDMLSDPVYQADLNRNAMAAGSGGGFADTMGGTMMVGSLMGSGSRGGFSRGSGRSRLA